MYRMRTIYSFVLAACLLLCGVTPIVAQEAEKEDPVIIAAPDTVIEKTAYTLSDQGVTIEVSFTVPRTPQSILITISIRLILLVWLVLP